MCNWCKFVVVFYWAQVYPGRQNVTPLSEKQAVVGL